MIPEISRNRIIRKEFVELMRKRYLRKKINPNSMVILWSIDNEL